MSIDDPRHPLQMALSAATMAMDKWNRIAGSVFNETKERWARGNARFHAARVVEIEEKIEAQRAKKGAVES
jgi:hypothetical protein